MITKFLKYLSEPVLGASALHTGVDVITPRWMKVGVRLVIYSFLIWACKELLL